MRAPTYKLGKQSVAVEWGVALYKHATVERGKNHGNSADKVMGASLSASVETAAPLDGDDDDEKTNSVHLRVHAHGARGLRSVVADGEPMRVFVEVSHGKKTFRSPVVAFVDGVAAWRARDTGWTFAMDGDDPSLRVDLFHHSMTGWDLVGAGHFLAADLVAGGAERSWVPLFRKASSHEEAGELCMTGAYLHPSTRSLPAAEEAQAD